VTWVRIVRSASMKIPRSRGGSLQCPQAPSCIEGPREGEGKETREGRGEKGVTGEGQEGWEGRQGGKGQEGKEKGEGGVKILPLWSFLKVGTYAIIVQLLAIIPLYNYTVSLNFSGKVKYKVLMFIRT